MGTLSLEEVLDGPGLGRSAKSLLSSLNLLSVNSLNCSAWTLDGKSSQDEALGWLLKSNVDKLWRKGRGSKLYSCFQNFSYSKKKKNYSSMIWKKGMFWSRGESQQRALRILNCSDWRPCEHEFQWLRASWILSTVSPIDWGPYEQWATVTGGLWTVSYSDWGPYVQWATVTGGLIVLVSPQGRVMCWNWGA